MNKLPQTATVSDIRHRHLDVLCKVEAGPVMLSSKGQPVAVVVSPEQWDKIVERLEDLDDLIVALQTELEIERGESEVVTVTEEELRTLVSGNEIPA